MNSKAMIHLLSRILTTAGAALCLTQCAGTDAFSAGGANASPVVNSLGMKFVPVPGTKILMCATETTDGQYSQSGLPMKPRPPFYSQAANHPVTNLTRSQATAWCEWLSKKEGKRYRLPTDREWSAAVGRATYPWGDTWPPSAVTENVAGQELRNSNWSQIAKTIGVNQATLVSGYNDGYTFTAPVGSLPSNRLGIHDLGGNVMEWVSDVDDKIAPNISFDRPSGKGYVAITRGSCWAAGGPVVCKSSLRYRYMTGFLANFREGNALIGFRCVMEP